MLFFKDPAESDLKQNRFAIRVRGTESETTATDPTIGPPTTYT